jgi:hypothetical protein
MMQLMMSQQKKASENLFNNNFKQQQPGPSGSRNPNVEAKSSAGFDQPSEPFDRSNQSSR